MDTAVILFDGAQVFLKQKKEFDANESLKFLHNKTTDEEK